MKEGVATVAEITPSDPDAELIPANVCQALSMASIKAIIPKAIAINPQPLQGAAGMTRCGTSFVLNGVAMEAAILMRQGGATAASFARKKENLKEVALASKLSPPQDIPGLGGAAFVHNGRNGGVEYLRDGILWSISVRDDQGIADPELSAALLASMLAQ